jgi:CRP-like cAMP-binding protein
MLSMKQHFPRQRQRCNELYDELSPEIHEKLTALETTATFPEGTQIMRAGVYPDNLIIITSGLVEISLPVARGAFSLVLAGRGKVLGLRSLISEVLPETNVTALKTTTVAMIPEREFARILHQYPQMYLAIAKVLSGDLNTADRLWRQAAGGVSPKRLSLRAV